MPEVNDKLREEWAEVHSQYREQIGETFTSMGVFGRPDAMRTAIREMRAALDGERGPVKDDEVGLDVPSGAEI